MQPPSLGPAAPQPRTSAAHSPPMRLCAAEVRGRGAEGPTLGGCPASAHVCDKSTRVPMGAAERDLRLPAIRSWPRCHGSTASWSGFCQIDQPCSPSGCPDVARTCCPASMTDQKSCSALSRLLVEQLLTSTEASEGTRKTAEASCLLEAASPPRLRTRCACCGAKTARRATVTAEIALPEQALWQAACP